MTDRWSMADADYGADTDGGRSESSSRHNSSSSSSAFPPRVRSFVLRGLFHKISSLGRPDWSSLDKHNFTFYVTPLHFCCLLQCGSSPRTYFMEQPSVQCSWDWWDVRRRTDLRGNIENWDTVLPLFLSTSFVALARLDGWKGGRVGQLSLQNLGDETLTK